MKNIALVLLLAGCSSETYGPEKTEPATVVDLPFVPAGHGSGSGFTSKGSVVFTSVSIPARYAVVFECEHGRFVVQGENQRALWSRLKVGQRVTVRYREVFEDGKVVDLDFLDARSSQ